MAMRMKSILWVSAFLKILSLNRLRHSLLIRSPAAAAPDVFAYLDEEPAKFSTWFMMIIDAKSYTHLEFAEYGKGRAEGSPFRGAEICVIFPCTLPNAVLLNCVLGVMSKLEVLRFIFGTLDTERQSFITREDFDNMCDVLMEHERNPHSMRRIRVLFDKHARRDSAGIRSCSSKGFSI